MNNIDQRRDFTFTFDPIMDIMGYNDQFRAVALSELAPYLSAKLLEDALKIARTIQDQSCKATALSSVAVHLPPELSEKVLQEARTLENELSWVQTLSALAPYLSTKWLEEALQIAQRIEDKELQREVLNEIIVHLPTPRKQEVVPKLIQTALVIKDEIEQAMALSQLVDHLPTNLSSQIQRAAQSQNKTYLDELGMNDHFVDMEDDFFVKYTPQLLQAEQAFRQKWGEEIEYDPLLQIQANAKKQSTIARIHNQYFAWNAIEPDLPAKLKKMCDSVQETAEDNVVLSRAKTWEIADSNDFCGR